MAIIPEEGLTTVVNRFIRYAHIDSGSIDDENLPSTPEQTQFAQVLLEEALSYGLDASLIPSGVRIHVEGNVPGATSILLGAHIDTAGETKNKGVKVLSHIVTEDDITLPSGAVISHARHPRLKRYNGKEIFTSDGTTLLGADDKAGVAAIMTYFWAIKQYDIPHGTIDGVLTFDEEGSMNGAKSLRIGIDTKAEYGFLLDGLADTICVETFNAASAFLTLPKHILPIRKGTEYKITLNGKYEFPGYGKKKGMVDAFRNLPEVIQIIEAAGLIVTSIGGTSGKVELYVNDCGQDRGNNQLVDRLTSMEDPRLQKGTKAVIISGPEKVSELADYFDLRPVAQLMSAIPYEMSAEQTEGKQGYIQPIQFVEQDGEVKLFVAIRDFGLEGLESKKAMLAHLPGIELRDGYRNVGEILKATPEIITVGQMAMQRAGVAEVILDSIRGGDEASEYTQKGMPSINLGDIGDDFHTETEWIAKDSLIQNVRIIANIAELAARGHLQVLD